MKTQQVLKPLFLALSSALLIVACGGGGSDSSSQDKVNQNNGNQNNDNLNNDNQDNGSPTTPDNSQTPDNVDSELATNAAIAKNFVDNIATPAYTKFASDSASLKTDIQSYCSSIGQANQSSNLQKAQAKAVALKNQWLTTKVVQVGIFSDNTAITSQVYTANPFAKDTLNAIAQHAESYNADNKYNIKNLSDTVRGLDVINYILFSDKKSDVKYCNYATALADDVNTSAKEVQTAWQNHRNNFLTTTVANGVDLVQPFFDAIVTVVDKELKDADLANPLGIKAGTACGTSKLCPNLVENPYSESSYASMEAKLNGVKQLFTGNGTGKGFNEFYTQRSMQSEATAFLANIDNAIRTIDAQSNSLKSQLSSIQSSNKKSSCDAVTEGDNSSDASLAPCKLYYQVKQVSDEVKTGSFKIAVNLNLPTAAAGDGD